MDAEEGVCNVEGDETILVSRPTQCTKIATGGYEKSSLKIWDVNISGWKEKVNLIQNLFPPLHNIITFCVPARRVDPLLQLSAISKLQLFIHNL
jgi:hypothetical protein